MLYTKTKNIEIGDIIECLTPDGWMHGKVTKLGNDKVTVFMDYLRLEKTFNIKYIKF